MYQPGLPFEKWPNRENIPDTLDLSNLKPSRIPHDETASSSAFVFRIPEFISCRWNIIPHYTILSAPWINFASISISDNHIELYTNHGLRLRDDQFNIILPGWLMHLIRRKRKEQERRCRYTFTFTPLRTADYINIEFTTLKSRGV